MDQFINPDSPIMRFITKIAQSVYLNILWLICCLPVFTAGASTTALFYVTLKMAEDKDGNITKAFFHSFKENFKPATKIWLVLLGLGAILALDGYVFYHMRFESVLWTIGTAIYIVALAAYAVVIMYIFPLLSRFDNHLLAMFKNSIIIGMRFLICTVVMAFIYFAMAFVIIRIFTPAVIFGEGLCALLCSFLLSNILRMCEGSPKADGAQEETG